MQPDPFCRTVVCHLFQGVHGAGTGCSGIGAYCQWIESRRAVLLYGLCQGLHIQTKASIAGHDANTFPTHPYMAARLKALWL